MKKVITGLLSFMLVLSLVPMPINAEESIENAKIGDDVIIVDDEPEDINVVEDDPEDIIIVEDEPEDITEVEEETQESEDKEETQESEDKEENTVSENETTIEDENSSVESNENSTDQSTTEVEDSENDVLEQENTEETDVDKESDYEKALEEEKSKEEVPDLKLEPRELEESKIARVSNSAEFLQAYQNPNISKIVLTTNFIEIKDDTDYVRNGSLEIQHEHGQAKIKFSPAWGTRSKYSSLTVKNGDLKLENIDIEGTDGLGKESKSGFIFRVDHGAFHMKNSQVRHVQNTELLRGMIKDRIILEGVDILTNQKEAFNIESSNKANNSITIELKGGRNTVHSEGAPTFRLKNQMRTLFEGSEKGGTINNFKSFGNNPIFSSDGDIIIENVIFGEARVDGNFIINTEGQVNIYNTRIQAISSDSDKNGFIKSDSVNIVNSDIATDGKVGMFIDGQTATINNSKINVKVEKSALYSGAYAAFFEGDKLEIGEGSDISVRTSNDKFLALTPNAMIRLSNLMISGQSILDINVRESGGSIMNPVPFVGAVIEGIESSFGTQSKFHVLEGSKLNIQSETVKSMVKIGDKNSNDALEFVVDGEGTEVNVTGNKKITGTNEAVVQINGKTKQQEVDGTGFYIRNGAKMNVSGKGKLLESNVTNGGYISVSGAGSELDFKQTDNTNAHALLFDEGQQIFMVTDKGSVNIQASDSTSSAMKMSRGSNTIDVRSQGRFELNKKGTRKFSDPKHNAAIEFAGKHNKFNVMDKGSYINLFSDQGPIVVGTGDFLGFANLPQLEVEVGEAASFVARGKTAIVGFDLFADAGIFNVSMFKLTANSPGYLDISNKRSGGQGRVLTKDTWFEFNATNLVDIKGSNMSFWEKRNGDSIYDNSKSNPDKDWVFSEMKASGGKLNNVTSPDKGLANYIIAKDGLINFSRINLNNLDPEVEGLHRISDTDRYIYGKVVVPDSADYSEYRPAWDDELYVDVIEFNSKGETEAVHKKLPTVGPETAAKKEYHLYDFEKGVLDEPNIGAGHFRIDLGEDTLAKKGNRFHVSRGYYLKPVKNDYGNPPIVYEEVDVDLKPSVPWEAEKEIGYYQTVHDKTPPTPVEFSENLYSSSKSISGKASFDTEKVFMYKKDGNDMVYISETNVSGVNWVMDIPDTVNLAVGDEFIFTAIDNVGNETPFAETVWHDTKFSEASRIIVEEENFLFRGKNLFYHVDDLSIKDLSTDDIIKQKMGIEVFNKQLDKNVEFNFVSDDAFDADNAKVGKYYFTVSPKTDDKVKKKYFIEIFDDSHIIKDDYIILAHDIYSNKNAANLKDDDIIKMANARAYNIKNGTIEEVEVSDRTKLTGNLQDQNFVSFAVKGKKDVEIEVEVFILDYDTVVSEKDTIIMANNFVRPLYEFKDDITDEEIIKLSNAKAYSLNRYVISEERNVEVMNHTVETKEGMYHADLRAGTVK